MDILTLSFKAKRTLEMKKLPFIFLLATFFVMASLFSCQKSGGGSTPPPVEEETLVVETTPTTLNNHVEAAAPGPDFPLKISVKSKMPANGVKIDVTTNPEGSATAFFTESRNSTAIDNNFSITNTPAAVTCIVNITVTSLTKPTNTWTGTYRYSRK